MDVDDDVVLDSSDMDCYDYDEESCYDSDAAADDDHHEFSYSDENVCRLQKRNYTVVKEEDLLQQQQDVIDNVSSSLFVTKSCASLLLLRYNWRDDFLDAWFANESKVREAVGLPHPKEEVQFPEKAVDCGICFESYQKVETATCGCSHSFCRTCWVGYVSTAINDGPGCLMLTCPEPSCRAAVDQDMVDLVASEKDKEKYNLFLRRSYFESMKNLKWCPAPGCVCAVKFEDCVNVESEDGVNKKPEPKPNYDVTCLCKHSFCWNCSEDSHSPLDCETVGKWKVKNSSESENTTWILAYTKPCPKCCKPIEKNAGCMHMTCKPPCKHEFCWLCLGPWSGHVQASGYYNCNVYDAQKKEGGEAFEAEKRKEMAKISINRYTHYYERFAANESSRKKALNDLQNIETTKLGKLSLAYALTDKELQCIIEAWLQIVECRRVLKWTYAYGYYLAETEKAKRQFFEYLQGQAESALERLHGCAEKELQKYLTCETNPQYDFNSFGVKLKHLTVATRTHFQKLVTALENGLSEVELHAAVSENTQKQEAKTNRFTPGGRLLSASEEEMGGWKCDHCTFFNVNLDAAVCDVCQQS